MYFLYLALWWRTFNFRFFSCTERELEVRIKFSFLRTFLSFFYLLVLRRGRPTNSTMGIWSHLAAS